MTSTAPVLHFRDVGLGDVPTVGGKGASLADMTKAQLNVPPGFTITTEACLAYLEHNALPGGVMDEVRAAMRELEVKTGKGFGDAANPLLVSVRSGSAMSMPGMMDTILNLGLNPATPEGLIHQTDNPAFGHDALGPLLPIGKRAA